MRDEPLNRPWSGTSAGSPWEFGQGCSPGPWRLSVIEHALDEDGQAIAGVIAAGAIERNTCASAVSHLPAHDGQNRGCRCDMTGRSRTHDIREPFGYAGPGVGVLVYDVPQDRVAHTHIAQVAQGNR